MAPFSTTALALNSPLFRGRQAELERLLQLCRDEVSSYVALYGGRQNGKTSLLLRLEARLQPSVHVCRVDFQLIKGAAPAPTFAHLAQQLALRLPAGGEYNVVQDGPALQQLLAERLRPDTINRFVLILDEWGALPPLTRETLANTLRAIFHTRLWEPALRKLQVIFSGGVELYDLVITEASSLHNICEEVYLADLAETEAVALIADNLAAGGVDPATATELGAAVYARAAGHPYLTQRIGRELARSVQSGASLSDGTVAAAVAQIQRGDPLLRRIRDDLREYKLEDVARRLLSDPPPFTRLDDAMARLELVGLAVERAGSWSARNPLLADVFHGLLGFPTPSASIGATAAAPTAADEQNHARELLERVQARLWALERQQAMFGLHTPAYISVEIDTTRAEVARLHGVLGIEPTEQSVTTGTNVETPPASAIIPITQPATARAASLSTQYSALNTIELMFIPDGPFLMGSSDADKLADRNEKPQHTLTMPDYWIGKTPITNAQFRPFVEGDGYTNRAYWTQVGWQWREREKVSKPQYWDNANWDAADYPVVGVNWFEAVAYCRWLSAQTGHPFRLPSEAEWEKAARGPDGLIWPWGDHWEAGRCNSKEAGIGKTTPVGQYPKGASPYGLLDLAGNVWEWCSTQWLKAYPYQVESEWGDAYLESNIVRVLRGGSWYFDQKLMRGASSRYFYVPPRFRDNVIGLRVASHSPLPDSES